MGIGDLSGVCGGCGKRGSCNVEACSRLWYCGLRLAIGTGLLAKIDICDDKKKQARRFQPLTKRNQPHVNEINHETRQKTKEKSHDEREQTEWSHNTGRGGFLPEKVGWFDITKNRTP